MKIFKYKRICIVGTIYGLFLYLLSSTEEEIRQTYFYIADTLPLSISNNIKNKTIFKDDISPKKHIWYIIKYRLLFHLLLYKHHFFAQDLFGFVPYLVGNYKYTLIEDAPRALEDVHKCGYMSRQEERWNSLNAIQKTKYTIFSRIFLHIHGQSPTCKKVLVTVPINPKYISNTICQDVIDIERRWKEISHRQKEYIYATFNISPEVLKPLQTAKVIVITQPFTVGGTITKEEQFDIYKNSIIDFNEKEVIIKPHPRDRINYRERFKDCIIFDIPIPFEFLNLLLPNLQYAITVNSGAVKSIKKNNLKIIWLGSEIHPNILKACGHVDL